MDRKNKNSRRFLIIFARTKYKTIEPSRVSGERRITKKIYYDD